MYKSSKRIALFLSVLLTFLLFTGCAGGTAESSDDSSAAVPTSEPASAEEESEPVSTQEEDEPAASDETWAIYWYLCGSDLESEGGAATSDLNEMMEVTLPENVKVVIETGGAAEWKNELVTPGVLGRYVYDSEGFELVDEQPDANMGEAETLQDFLSFCLENYPADKQMVLFWNHGGGSVNGAAFDELHDFDSLTLDEMYAAFSAVCEVSTDAPPFEMVGFDTCLMATIDTAYTFYDIANYMVASEELEPSCGWYYSGWVGALAENPGIDGAALGEAICETFREGCELEDVAEDITLSVIDLQQLGPLVTAYNNLGSESLTLASSDPTFFAELGRAATRAENYGGNTPDEGYTNMVDLGHLMRNSTDLLPENAEAVLSALEQCVVYRINSPYREEATGLSCYYPYNQDENEIEQYAGIGVSDSFTQLYRYSVSGELDEAGMAYISDLGIDELPEIPTAENSDVELEDHPVEIDEDGSAVLNLGVEAANLLKGVYFQLSYLDEEDDLILVLGYDNDLYMDWDNGIFYDNFRGVWGALDGSLCYMEIIYEGEDYNLYSIPMLLNGEEYNLRVVYDYNSESYGILGARKGLDDTGMADRNLRQLQEGDEITLLLYASSISGDDDFVQVEVDTLTVTADTSFEEADLGDGTFMMLYEMVDVTDTSYYSEAAYFTVEDGEIYTLTE